MNNPLLDRSGTADMRIIPFFRLKTAVHGDIHFSPCTTVEGTSTETKEGGQIMEIQSLTEQQKKALAEISMVVYGEELTRIMIPELKDYLNGSSKRDESPELIHKD
jgi:hypothetical protein